MEQHHHVTDDDTAGCYLDEARATLAQGEPLPVDLRIRLQEAGFNVEAVERKYAL